MKPPRPSLDGRHLVTIQGRAGIIEGCTVAVNGHAETVDGFGGMTAASEETLPVNRKILIRARGAIVDFGGSMQSAAQSWTAEKNYERDGGDTAPATEIAPVLPADFPPAVPPGIVSRFRALARRVRNSKGATDAILAALGLVGAEQTGPDMTTLQAVLTLTLQGNAVLIGWGWQGFSNFLDMLEIQVDRGDGKGWVFLTYDTTPNYTDTFPFPSAPAKWKYRAIYRVGDAQVGVWSNEVSIIVGS